MTPEQWPVGVRAWTTLADPPAESTSEWMDFGPSNLSLILDTETTTDVAQGLRFGTYQVRHRQNLREKDIFYDPGGVSPDERSVIREYTRERRLKIYTLERFIHIVFLYRAWKCRAVVVGFNLPFDLSRIAIDHADARPRGRDQSMRGGFSFALTPHEYDPRIQINKIGPRAAFIRFATPAGRQGAARNRERGGNIANHRGYFIDAATVAAAILGEKLTLARLAELLDTEHRKIEWADHNTEITSEYLDYAMNDTQVHWEVYAALRDRYQQLGLETPLHQIYSAASIAKGYLT